MDIKPLRSHLISHSDHIIFAFAVIKNCRAFLCQVFPMILTSNMQPTAFTHCLDILTTKLLNRYCSIPVDAQGSQAGFHQVWRNFQAAEYISFSQLEITYLAHIYTAKFNHISLTSSSLHTMNLTWRPYFGGESRYF